VADREGPWHIPMGGGESRSLSRARTAHGSLHERNARQAPEAEHSDREPDDPENRDDAHDERGIPQSPRTAPVGRDEDRPVWVRGRLPGLGFDCRHGV